MRTWATNLAKYADSVEVESNNEHSANSKAFSDSHGVRTAFTTTFIAVFVLTHVELVR